MKRRTFVQGITAAGALVMLTGVDMIKTLVAKASEWPKAAFEAEDFATSVSALFGDLPVEDSDAVAIKAPLQAENGAVVPIKISTSIEGAEAIAVFVEKNPVPLVTSVNLGEGASGFYSARIKMGETSPVYGYVKAGGKLYRTSQEIKVTVGGCGG